jgi:pimeloyl-ACP methyl ester carboxylesterase
MLAEAMLPRLFSAHSRRQRANVVAATEQVMRAARPATLAAALRGMAQRTDATSWLSAIDVPALVVCGQEDVISSPHEMEQMAAAMPQAEYAVIPACGHMAPLEDPVHVNKALRAFLNRG